MHWSIVFESSPLGMGLADLDGNFLVTNHAYQALLGFTAEQLRSLSVLDLTHEADRERSARLLAQLKAGELSEVKQEQRYTASDGRVIWVRATTSLVRDDAGRPMNLMGIVEDITDSKRAEEILRRSEAYLTEGQRSSHTGSWGFNPAANELFWSREMYRITGFDPEHGPPPREEYAKRIHPDDRGIAEAAIRAAIRERTEFEGEYRMIMPEGEVRTILYRGRPVTHEGQFEYVGTVMDITDSRGAEERLSASLREVHSLAGRLLRVQDEERRRLARELHETTAQDLAAVKMSLASLERLEPAPSAARQAVLDEIGDLVNRALTDVRTTSYLLHPPLLEEAGLASALRWYVEGFTRRSGIAVDVELPEHMDRLAPEGETALFRVVQESLINIHRHADSPIAHVRLRREDDNLVLEIEDQGRGMPHAPGGSPHGSEELGVGIAGMRERMVQLGGTLEIASASTGTIVRAVVPLGEEKS